LGGQAADGEEGGEEKGKKWGREMLLLILFGHFLSLLVPRSNSKR
jgi:hypothetical protein